MCKLVSDCRVAAVFWAAAVVFFVAGPALAAGKIENYTADQVTIDPDGTVVNKGKVYRAPEKMRMEMTPAGTAQRLTMIYRQDLKKQYILNTEKKRYVEKDLEESDMMRMSKQYIQSQETTSLGTETVNGFKCEKKQIETTMEVMGMQHKSKTVVWLSDRLDMPIRSRSEDGYTTELQHIQKGKPADSYFEVPAGYQQVSNMMMLMTAGMEEQGVDQQTMQQLQELQQQKEGLPFKMPKMPKGMKLPFGKSE